MPPIVDVVGNEPVGQTGVMDAVGGIHPFAVDRIVALIANGLDLLFVLIEPVPEGTELPFGSGVVLFAHEAFVEDMVAVAEHGVPIDNRDAYAGSVDLFLDVQTSPENDGSFLGLGDHISGVSVRQMGEVRRPWERWQLVLMGVMHVSTSALLGKPLR